MSRLATLLTVLTVLAAACADTPAPTTPAPADETAGPLSAVQLPDAEMRVEPPGQHPYPLATGNQWKYVANVRFETLPQEGPGEVEVVVRTTETEISGSEMRDGHCYAVETRTITEDVDPGEVITNTIRYRQDRAGLYEADVPIMTPTSGVSPIDAPTGLRDRLAARPEGERWLAALDDVQSWRAMIGRPGGGPVGSELVRLLYPLRPGQTWDIIDDGDFWMTATVEGRDNLDLAFGPTPAWRIRYESSLWAHAEDETEVIVWYGREGYLGLSFTAVIEATNETGEPIGDLAVSDMEFLRDLDVDYRGESPCAEAAPARDGRQVQD